MQATRLPELLGKPGQCPTSTRWRQTNKRTDKQTNRMTSCKSRAVCGGALERVEMFVSVLGTTFLIFCRGEVRRRGLTRRSCVATGSVELAAGERGRRLGRSPSSPARSSSAGFRSSASRRSGRSAALAVFAPSRLPSSASSRGSATSTASSTRSSTPSLTRTFDAPSDASCQMTLIDP